MKVGASDNVIFACVADRSACLLLYRSLQVLRDKEQHDKTAAQAAGINFEDFRRFQMLVAYHLEEIERALTLFGKAASVTGDKPAGTTARFGACASHVGA